MKQKYNFKHPFEGQKSLLKKPCQDFE